MADLKCERCGAEKSYADANIADIHETCEKKVKANSSPDYPDTVTVPAKHEWSEIGNKQAQAGWR